MFTGNTASQVIVTQQGRHVWNGAVAQLDVAHGTLEQWKTGENGGVTECWHARLMTGQAEPEHVLDSYSSSFTLIDGSPFENKPLPRPIWRNDVRTDSIQDIIGYEWNYYPSTE